MVTVAVLGVPGWTPEGRPVAEMATSKSSSDSSRLSSVIGMLSVAEVWFAATVTVYGPAV